MDDEDQFENWRRITVNHLLGAADGFREMILHASTGTVIGDMMHNIDMLLGEAETWMPDGHEWPVDENETQKVIAVDFHTRRRI
jgi:hypothetical protein